MKLLKLFNKIRYKFLIKEARKMYPHLQEWDLDAKINFLKEFNLEKGNYFSSGGFCNSIVIFQSRLYTPIYYRELQNMVIFIPELFLYAPVISKKFRYWFKLDEEGQHKRHEIANDLLGILEERKREILRSKL
jgi:hypothetical protein